MPILEDIRRYFKGERTENALLTLLGILAAAGVLVIYFNYYYNTLARGLMWSLVFLALFALGTGGFNFLHNVYRLRTLDKEFKDTPNFYVASEIARMHKLGKLKMPFLITWTVLIAAGIIMIIISNDLVRGISIGILFTGCTGHTIDFFAERRNKWYRKSLGI